MLKYRTLKQFEVEVMFKLVLPLVLLGALSTASCTVPREFAGYEQVDERYAAGGGTWDFGGGLFVGARVRDDAGTVGICGAWAAGHEPAQIVGLNARVIETGVIYLDGTRILTDLSFMQPHRRGTRLSGRRAACVNTALAWRPEYAGAEPEIRFPRQVFKFDARRNNKAVFQEARVAGLPG